MSLSFDIFLNRFNRCTQFSKDFLFSAFLIFGRFCFTAENYPILEFSTIFQLGLEIKEHKPLLFLYALDFVSFPFLIV